MTQSTGHTAPAPQADFRSLVEAFLRHYYDGPGLIDCINNDGNRYTSQALVETIERARAALAATEGRADV